MHTHFLIQGSRTGILLKDSCQERWLDVYIVLSYMQGHGREGAGGGVVCVDGTPVRNRTVWAL